MSNQAYVTALKQLLTQLPEFRTWLVPDDRQPQGWVAFENEAGHRVLIARTALNVPVCHTSLPIAPGMSHAVSGAVLPSKTNGKIRAHFQFSVGFIRANVLPLMRDLSVPLPERRQRASGPSSSGPRLTPAEVLAMIAADDKPVASGPTPVYPTDDLSDELIDDSTF